MSVFITGEIHFESDFTRVSPSRIPSTIRFLCRIRPLGINGTEKTLKLACLLKTSQNLRFLRKKRGRDFPSSAAFAKVCRKSWEFCRMFCKISASAVRLYG